MGIKEVSLYSTLYIHNNDKGPTEAVAIEKTNVFAFGWSVSGRCSNKKRFRLRIVNKIIVHIHCRIHMEKR